MIAPRALIPILLAVLVLALSAAARAQAPAYPDFVGRTTTVTQDEETSVALEMEEAQPLVGDLLSTETWTQTRARIEPAIEDLRVLFLSRAAPAEVDQQIGTIAAELDRLELMAPYQAPNEAEGLRFYQRRLLRQLEIWADESESNNFPAMESADRLVRATLRDWNELLVRSDLMRSGSLGAAALVRVPEDWDVPAAMTVDGLGIQLSTWDSARIVSEVAERHAHLSEALRRRRNADVYLLRELSEMGRELATRTWEVPSASRTPFRNAALRLDVLAENAALHIEDGNRSAARRQLRAMGRVVQELEQFVQLRQRGL